MGIRNSMKQVINCYNNTRHVEDDQKCSNVLGHNGRGETRIVVVGKIKVESLQQVLNHRPKTTFANSLKDVNWEIVVHFRLVAQKRKHLKSTRHYTTVQN